MGLPNLNVLNIPKEGLSMKKILLGSAAVVLGLALSAPAQAATANGISLNAGGQFNGYVVWGRQSTFTGVKDRSLDILRDTEVNLQGEDTLDNGLTVGVYNEFDIDGTQGLDGQLADAPNVGTVSTKESYAYFSGAWGRVNFGKEDGAAYLLQVAAPSADSNIDGLRQLINPVNYSLTNANSANVAIMHHDGVNLSTWLDTFGLDYSNDVTGDYNKLTYLTPVFSGFQFGVSYTPDVNNFGLDTTGTAGVTQNNSLHSFGSAFEGSGRYEGKFQGIDVTLGGGYSDVTDEKTDGTNDVMGSDGFKQWNLGGNVGWEAFNFGLAYLQDNGGVSDNIDGNKTWDAGVDYTTGPYKLGFSYLNNKLELDSATNKADTDRYTGGLVYTYGPGMTFRGSVSYVKTALPTVSDVTATDVLVGTQINF